MALNELFGNVKIYKFKKKRKTKEKNIQVLTSYLKGICCCI